MTSAQDFDSPPNCLHLVLIFTQPLFWVNAPSLTIEDVICASAPLVACWVVACNRRKREDYYGEITRQPQSGPQERRQKRLAKGCVNCIAEEREDRLMRDSCNLAPHHSCHLSPHSPYLAFLSLKRQTTGPL